MSPSRSRIVTTALALGVERAAALALVIARAAIDDCDRCANVNFTARRRANEPVEQRPLFFACLLVSYRPLATPKRNPPISVTIKIPIQVLGAPGPYGAAGGPPAKSLHVRPLGLYVRPPRQNFRRRGPARQRNHDFALRRFHVGRPCAALSGPPGKRVKFVGSTPAKRATREV